MKETIHGELIYSVHLHFKEKVEFAEVKPCLALDLAMELSNENSF